jgi:hypothetical protein
VGTGVVKRRHPRGETACAVVVRWTTLPSFAFARSCEPPRTGQHETSMGRARELVAVTMWLVCTNARAAHSLRLPCLCNWLTVWGASHGGDRSSCPSRRGRTGHRSPRTCGACLHVPGCLPTPSARHLSRKPWMMPLSPLIPHARRRSTPIGSPRATGYTPFSLPRPPGAPCASSPQQVVAPEPRELQEGRYARRLPPQPTRTLSQGLLPVGLCPFPLAGQCAACTLLEADKMASPLVPTTAHHPLMSPLFGCDRVKYEETIGDLRNKVAKKTTVPADKLQVSEPTHHLVVLAPTVVGVASPRCASSDSLIHLLRTIAPRGVEPSGLAEAASLTACGLLGGMHPQLFWHRKELVSSVYDHLTLAQMRIHTGFSFEAYDLVRARLPWTHAATTRLSQQHRSRQFHLVAVRSLLCAVRRSLCTALSQSTAACGLNARTCFSFLRLEFVSCALLPICRPRSSSQLVWRRRSNAAGFVCRRRSQTTGHR